MVQICLIIIVNFVHKASLLESQAISAGLPVVPFAIPCLAVLGTSHEDTCLTPGVFRNWKQQQQSAFITQQKETQKRMSDLSFAASTLALPHTSVLKPRSFPSPMQNKIKVFDSKFLAACEFISHTSHGRQTSHFTRHTSHVTRHTSLSPGNSCFGPPSGSQVWRVWGKGDA